MWTHNRQPKRIRVDDIKPEQKRLLKAIVKPEADAACDFISTEFTKDTMLLELDEKYRAKVISDILKLRKSGISLDDIGSLVVDENSDWEFKMRKWTEDGIMDPDIGEDIYEDDIDEKVEGVIGLNHMNFKWTRNLLKESVIANVQRKVKANALGRQSRLTQKSLGFVTHKQKLADWPRLKKEFEKAEIDTWPENISEEEKKENMAQLAIELAQFKDKYMERASKKKKHRKKGKKAMTKKAKKAMTKKAKKAKAKKAKAKKAMTKKAKASLSKRR